MRELLLKSFVYPFYKAYLGFFILILTIFGVFMELKQHLMLAEKILLSQKWFTFLLLAFVIYVVLQWSFQKKLIHDPRYRQFQKFSFLSFRDFVLFFSPVWLANHSLLLLYFLLLFFTGIPLLAWSKLVILIVFLGVSYGLSLYFTFLRFRNFHPEKLVQNNQIIKKKPFSIWFLFHLKENRPLLLLLVKGFSLFILSGFFYSFFAGKYDVRWLAFGLLIGCFIHYPIWLEKWEFGERKLYFFRNLPLRFMQKIRLELLTILMLTLPEIVLILFHGRAIESNSSLIYLIFFWLSLHPGMIALCHLTQVKQQYNLLYFAFFGVFLAIIFGFNLAILALVFLISFGYSIHSPLRI